MPSGRNSTRGKDMTTGDDLEEIKRSLNFMSGELTKLTSQQEHLVGLMEEVKMLKTMLIEKDRKLLMLEQRVDELEQHMRRDNVVLTGLETRHRTYAQATANSDMTEDAPQEELLTLEQQVVGFLHSKNINIQSDAISVCHTLPRKTDKTKPAIIITFISRKQRNDVLMQAKKLKGTNVYLNEHLTKRNGDIAREARMLRKQKKIIATWTRNGNVWIREQEGSQAKIIRDLKELDTFKRG